MLLAGLVLLWLGVTQTGLLRWALLPIMERSLPCEVAAGRVTISPKGWVVFHGMRLRVPGTAGPEGEFFSAPRVAVRVKLLSLLGGAPQVSNVVLSRPMLLISQGPDARLNIQDLAGSRGTGQVRERIPSIEVRNGLIRLAEHDATGLTDLASIRAVGQFTGQPQTPGLYTFSLIELAERASGTAQPSVRMQVEGQINVRSLEGWVNLRGVDLTQWGTRSAPSTWRELWIQLALRGSIEEATLAFSEEAGPTATFRLEGVDLNIPIPADEAEDVSDGEYALPRDEETRLLRLLGVTGSISFARSGIISNMSGSMGGLPCDVSFRTDGLTLVSGIDCKIRSTHFRVVEQPELLLFAPEYVRRLFYRFSGPTADVSGVIEIKRGPPVEGEAAPLRISGALTFENGSAQYAKFPYPITRMSGTVNFDPNEIDIVAINGRGPTGAGFLASGRIAPPNETAGVDLLITLVDAPIDAPFIEAIPEARKPLFTAIFNEAAYEELLRKGLVMPGDRHAAMQDERQRTELDRRLAERRGEPAEAIEAYRQQIAELDRSLAIPVFDLAGRANVSVGVHRPVGDDESFAIGITVDVAKAGIVPRAFPYPTIARNVRIEIEESHAAAEAPDLQGLTGAVGSLLVHVAYDQRQGGSYEPRIEIDVERMPVDTYLIAAIGARETVADIGPEDPAAPDLAPSHVLERLGLQGNLACRALIGPDATGEMVFRADAVLMDLSSRPLGGGLELTGINGELVIDQHNVQIQSVSGKIGEGTFDLSLDVRYPDDRRGVAPEVTGAGVVNGLDLSLDVESMIGALLPAQAAQTRALRDRFNFGGDIDLSILLTPAQYGTALPDYLVRIESARELTFDLLDGRAAIYGQAGTVSLRASTLSLRGFRGVMRFDEQAVGRVYVEGDWPLGEPTARHVLDVRLDDLDLVSSLSRRVLDRVDPRMSESKEAYRVEGICDVGARFVHEVRRPPMRSAWIEPKRFAFVVDGARVEFPEVTGRLTAGADGQGSIRGLRARAPHWSIGVDGSWFNDRERLALDIGLEMEGAGLPSELLAMIPSGVRSSLEAIELGLDGGFALRDARLTLERPSADAGAHSLFRGHVDIEGAKLRPVVQIDGLNGTATIEVEEVPGGEGARADVVVHADRLRVMGVSMSDATAHITTQNASDRFVIPLVRASTHGGTVVANAAIDSSKSASYRTPEYEASIELAGLDFGRLIAELRSVEGEEVNLPRPMRRGELDGSISLAGEIGHAPSRRGRGLLRITGGDVLAVPGMMALMRLSNLQLPFDERLSFAYADFFLRGDRVTIRDVQAHSPSLVIAGEGTVGLPDLELGLRFRTHSNQRIPLLSDLLEGVRDELITAVVTGTLREPEFRFEQFTATRQMLGAIFPAEESSRRPPAVPVRDPHEDARERN